MANTITLEALKNKLDNDDQPVIVEVLSPQEYGRAHIPGALNIPYQKITKEAKERFETDEEIVVYCSDEECTASEIAAEKLDSSGFSNVFRYKGGKKEWSEAGLPLESSKQD